MKVNLVKKISIFFPFDYASFGCILAKITVEWNAAFFKWISRSIQCLYKHRTVGDGTIRSEVFVTSMNETIIRFLRLQVRGLYARSTAKVGLLYRVSGVS